MHKKSRYSHDIFQIFYCLDFDIVSTNKKTQLNIQSANRSNYNFEKFVKRVEKNFIKRNEIVSKWFIVFYLHNYFYIIQAIDLYKIKYTCFDDLHFCISFIFHFDMTLTNFFMI